MTYWDKIKYWNEYQWKKCRKERYYQRIAKWIAPEQAVLPKSIRFHTVTTETGRVCTKCLKMLPFCDFSIDNRPEAYKWRTTQCKQCRNIAKAKMRMDKDYNELEKEYKRNIRKTEHWILATDFDNKYYTDKQIKKNREIIKQVRPITREQARLAKIQYFFYRGVPVEMLKKAYWEFNPYQDL